MRQPRGGDEVISLVGRREASVLILLCRFMFKLLTLGSHCLPRRNCQDNYSEASDAV